MTAPITGPYTKDEYLWDKPSWNTGTAVYKAYTLKRRWYRQAKPFNLPLDFDSITRRGNSLRTSTGPYGNSSGSWTECIVASAPDVPATHANTYNQAYARFVNQWKNACEMGIATAEGREAMSMITSRLTQMARFTGYLARGKIGLAAGSLGIEWAGGTRRKQRRTLPPQLQKMADARKASLNPREAIRQFSSLYLEFYFGWKPLVKDIIDAVEVLDEPFKTFRVRSSARVSYKDNLSIAYRTWEDSTTRFTEFRDGTYKQKISIMAEVAITNPNLAMAQSFGVLNPISIAWNLIPFSFVLDWFVNVGDYLSSLTDFAGVTLVRPQVMTFTEWNGEYLYTSTPKPGYASSQNTLKQEWKANTVHCIRRNGLGGGPSIRLRASKPWEVQRGVAAASLLMQRFPRQVIDRNALTIAAKRTAFRQNVFPQFYGKYF